MSSIKNEIWKDLEGYEGIYQVSNTGKDFISNILYLYSMFCAYYDKKL